MKYGYFHVPDDVETSGRRDRKEVLSYLLRLDYKENIKIHNSLEMTTVHELLILRFTDEYFSKIISNLPL